MSRRLLPTVGVAAVILLLGGCASAPRIQSDLVPAGSLRLAQVTELFTQQDILGSKNACDTLQASGVSRTEIRDGSLGAGRVYCCGGPPQQATVFYVPPTLRVKLGDVVEVRIGRPQGNGGPGQVNTVTRIRQQAGDKQGSVRWDPPDERLWMRILYADWMPREGWVYQGGLAKTWYKPPPR